MVLGPSHWLKSSLSRPPPAGLFPLHPQLKDSQNQLWLYPGDLGPRPGMPRSSFVCHWGLPQASFFAKGMTISFFSYKESGSET